MKVLLIGNGAREHAIAAAVRRSEKEPELYAFMKARNPGIARLCKDLNIGDICYPDAVVKYAKSKNIDLAVVGPEAPLEVGVVDALEEAGVMCASPCQSAARLETDKSFTRSLLKKHHVKGAPEFGIFSDASEAEEYIENAGHEIVVKPAGLTGGKGVKIQGEHLGDGNEVKEYAREVLEASIGTVGKVVLEERLIGEEFTLQAFTSGTELIGTPMVQDHKRAYEGDVGPNTGGMGSYSDKGYILPFLERSDYDEGLEIMKDSLEAVKKETGKDYKGFLYGQFIATSKGLRLIEFNARLGDPEAMNTLSVLESDFMGILEGMATGDLPKNINFAQKATVCKYLVPEGYPVEPRKNEPIQVNEKGAEGEGALLYYAAVDEREGQVYTSSSRAIGIVGVADTIEKAENISEAGIKHVKGPLRHRTDIGTRALIEKRIQHMEELRKK